MACLNRPDSTLPVLFKDPSGIIAEPLYRSVRAMFDPLEKMVELGVRPQIGSAKTDTPSTSQTNATKIARINRDAKVDHVKWTRYCAYTSRKTFKQIST
jgi:hypothetical protein